tara:strand:+ start:109 stop:534 length:426 start_codon:yes stop_codon:yes gene_type:complete
LWKSIGGHEKAQSVNLQIAKHVDVMIGNELDFTFCLGLDDNISHIDIVSFKKMIKKTVFEFPNFRATATTFRVVETATVNGWGAICWHDGQFYESTAYPARAVNYGAAHGALAMTTPGDTSMATVAEVEKIMSDGGALVVI